MKLTEALNSNPAKLKRTDWDMWITSDSYISHPITIVDMQADDWVMVEKTVQVSRTQLMEMANKFIAPGFDSNMKFEYLCKGLGLT